MSHPTGRSVNDFIDSEFTSVQYTSFDKALQISSKLGQNALLAKIDILLAFRFVILHPDDFYLALSSEVNIILINVYQWGALHHVLYLKKLHFFFGMSV